TLTDLGYVVFEAENAAEALEIARRADPVDLLVTDMVMPGVRGDDLAQQLRDRWPSIGVLFMSGHTDSVVTVDRDEAIEFLPKPFSPDALAERVRGVIDGSKV